METHVRHHASFRPASCLIMTTVRGVITVFQTMEFHLIVNRTCR